MSMDSSGGAGQGAGGSGGLGIRNGKPQSNTQSSASTSRSVADRSATLGHQKRHSMLGKFASGIARSTGQSKDKDKDKASGGGSHVSTQGSGVAGTTGVKR